MKGKCKCERVFTIYSEKDVINCECGAIIVKVNGKWKMYKKEIKNG